MPVELYKSGATRCAAAGDLFTIKVTDKNGVSISATLSVGEWAQLIAKPRIIIKD